MAQTHLPVPLTDEAAIAAVTNGLPYGEAVYLAEELGLKIEEFAAYVGIPKTTFFRRKGKRFSRAESDRIMRYARLFDLAKTVFGDDASAREWLSEPAFGLDGDVPLARATIEVGAQQVELLLNRIRYNVAQ